MTDSHNHKKEVISIVFIGHVDAGKSTIAGQILNQLGLIDSRTLEKYQKESAAQNRESWYLSWALDTNPEERERGKTTELGRASFDLPTKKVVVLDAPGHKLYVADMIGGANQADVGVLVVSARTNEFEAGFEKGGQTREHILLCKAGRVSKLVVLVNKMDEVQWSQQRYEEIHRKLNELVKKLYAEKDTTYIPVSGFHGHNIASRHSTWYTGPSFLEYLDTLHVPRNLSSLTFCISERIKSLGTTLYTGKLETGILSKNKGVLILPQKIPTVVTALYDEEDNEIEQAQAGDTLSIRLRDALEEVNEGDIVVDESTELRVCQVFTCMLTVLDTKSILSVGYQSVLHVRLAAKNCKVLEFRSTVNGKMVKRPFVRKGEKVLAKIQCEGSVVFNVTEGCADKFALRDEGMTVAIGVVRKVCE